MHIVFERTRDTEQRIQGQKKHEREHVIQGENLRAVCKLVSPLFPLEFFIACN